MYFALPPAALSGMAPPPPTSSTSAPYHPMSPLSPEVTAGEVSSRFPRQRSNAKRPAADYNLPPPPTRTRKIIQMKPKTQDQARVPVSEPKPRDSANPAPPATVTSTSKRKPASATTAAGRKIARKTAHSLIERRRRSKMNEEFTTLKDMIPACKGQEMHKLAILQVCSRSPSFWLLVCSRLALLRAR